MVNAPDNFIIAPIFVIEVVSTIMLILFIFAEFSLRQKRHMIERALKEKEGVKAEMLEEAKRLQEEKEEINWSRWHEY